MVNAPTDALLPSFEARLRLAADPFDLDRVGARIADPVEDLANAAKVNTSAVADRGKVPIFEATAIVLHVDVSDQVFDLFQLIAGVGAGL